MPCSVNGAPGEIRTPDHQVRSLVLYPTELRARGELICRGAIAEAMDAEARSGIIQTGRCGVNTFFKNSSLRLTRRLPEHQATGCILDVQTQMGP